MSPDTQGQTPQLPSTPEAAEVLVREMKKAGLLSRERLLVMADETGDAARAVVEGSAGSAAVEPPPPEQAPEKRISFAEAVESLKGKLDIMAAGDEAVKAHGRWGYIDAMIRAGKLEDPKQYAALFDRATLSEKDLERVRADIERGGVHMPIFDAGLLLPHEQWQALFEEAGIPYWENTYGLNNLPVIRRINPADIPNLEGLHDRSWEDNLAAFKATYEKTEPLKATGPRIIFTPDTKEVSRTGISATADMQSLRRGGDKTLDIGASLIRFRAFMDRGLRTIAQANGVDFDNLDTQAFKNFLESCFGNRSIDQYMPDKDTITRSSDCVYPDGGVACLRWHPDYRWVYVDDYYPVDGYDIIGSRLALG